MATLTLPQKFQMKPHTQALILNAPEGWTLPDLLEGVTVSTAPQPAAYDFVLLFCAHQADINAHALNALQALKPSGGMWFAYPKGSGALKTDINRDQGWTVVTEAGWDGVRQISIDATWSALRFRPVSEIKYTPGSSRNPNKG